MLDSLSTRLQSIFDRLGGRGRLSEDNIQEALREVRVALLEADVNFKVVRAFMERVREKAVGQDVLKSLTPAQQVVKVVHDELIELLGGSGHRLSAAPHPPTVIMLMGLQGSGKTTTAAKLARMYGKQGQHPIMAAADTYRPAAQDQLRTLGAQLSVHHLDDLLRRCERLQHVLPNGLRLHAVDEPAHDLEVDVGLQQRHADFPQGLLDVVFAQTALAAQPIEDRGQSCAQRVEHGKSEFTELCRTFQLLGDRAPAYRVIQASAAARSSRMALAGSSTSNTAEPATRIDAPCWASGRACSTFTPPSMETSTARAPSIVRICRIFG